MTNTKYTKDEKAKLTQRLLPPENYSITKLSNETGISKSTLSTWKSKSLNGKSTKSTSKLTQNQKFLLVMETYTLSEIELSEYCRKNGYYINDIKTWRQNCINSNSKNAFDYNKTKELEISLKEEKYKTKILSKDLRRKERALAETAALLVLRKKLNAIFEETEED